MTPSLHLNIYLFLQILDLNLLVVELVSLLPHGLQQLYDAPLLAVDHLLIREEIIGTVKGRCYLIVNITHNTQSLYYRSLMFGEQIQNKA